MAKSNLPLVERLFGRALPIVDGCWEWQGSLNDGYGVIGIGTQYFKAHRVAYELLIGPIPQGLTIDHLCRNRRCLNPMHMEPVTLRENIARRPHEQCGWGRNLTHCHAGHPFTPENIIRSRANQQHRRCRTCHLAWRKSDRDRRRQAAVIIAASPPGPVGVEGGAKGAP